jgi:pilus assembly protein CpaB
MQGKQLVMLALAGAIGLGAMLMTMKLMNRKPAEEAMRDVLVAVRDFKEEEALKPDMLTTVKMAESAIPIGAFAKAEDVADRWVRTVMLEGEPVVERKLGPKGSPPGLVANIPKGMRAFAVEVNEQSGVSGFILPSHRVDVIQFETGDRSSTLKRGVTILQDVLVLAAGQVFVKSEEKTLQSRTVTLAVTPDQVDVLVAAKAKGVLSLALRGVNDHEVVERPAPVSKVDDEAEKRKRIAAEEELARLKQEHEAEKARRVAAEKAAARKEQPAARRVGVIYRIPNTRLNEFSLTGRGGQPYPPPPAEPMEAEPDEHDPGPDSNPDDGPRTSPASLVQRPRPDSSRYTRSRAR